MSWEKAIKFVLGYEGSSYENDPNDLGGETKYGISKKAYPHEDIPNMTRERAEFLYRRDYWEPICGDKLPSALAMVVFDCAVNQGLARAIRLMQIILEVTPDGEIGPRTLEAARFSTERHVWLYLLYRARLYMQTKTVDHWGHNWGTRLIRLADALFFQEPVA